MITKYGFFYVILMDFEWEKLLILVTTKNSSLVCEWKSTERMSCHKQNFLFGITNSSINSSTSLFVSLSRWVILCIDEKKNTAANYVQFVPVHFVHH